MEIAPKIEDAKAAVQAIPPLLEAIVALIQTPPGWIFVGASLCWLILHRGLISNTLELIDRRQKRKIEFLDAYVNAEEMGDPETLTALRDLRSAHYFEVATKIYAEHRLREALIRLHAQTSHKVQWKHIRGAFPYITVNADYTISIREIPLLDKLSYWYNDFVGYTSFLAAAGVFAVFVVLGNKATSSLIGGVCLTLFLLFFGVFARMQNLPKRARTLLQKEISAIFSESPHAQPHEQLLKSPDFLEEKKAA